MGDAVRLQYDPDLPKELLTPLAEELELTHRMICIRRTALRPLPICFSSIPLIFLGSSMALRGRYPRVWRPMVATFEIETTLRPVFVSKRGYYEMLRDEERTGSSQLHCHG